MARLGLFAPRIEPLSTEEDSARYYYESFRVHQNRGAALATLGAIATFWGLVIVGAGFEIAGGINMKTGRDRLHRAMWFDNRSLVVGR